MIENSLLRIKASVSGDNEIKRLGNTMKGVQGQVQNLRSGVGKLAGAFKALFAAAAVSGFAAYVKSAADAADAFGKLEVRTGIAAEKLVGYVQAGKLADVSQDQLIDSLKTLAQTQTEAAKGTASYAEAYAKLGVSVKNSDGTLKASDKLLGEIADQFKDLPDGPEKAALAMNLFGEVGLKLITVLNGGSASLEEFNYNLSDKFAQNAEYYNDQITKLSFAFEGFQMQLMDALMPALISITEVFAELFSTEADWEALFSVIEFGLRSVAIATLTVIKGIDEQIRLVKTAIDIVNTALSGDLGKAGQIAQQYGAGFMERLETSGSQFDRLMFGRGEAPEGYGRRGGRRFQVGDVVGGDTAKQVKAAKERRVMLQEVFNLENAILDAREQQNDYAQVLAELNLAIFQANQKMVDDPLAGALALRKAEINANEQILAIDQQRVEQAEALEEAFKRLGTDLADLLPESQNLDELWKSIGSTITSSVTGAIEGAIFEAKTLQESLTGILRSLARVFLQFGTKTLIGGLFPSANGNVFAQNKIVPFAYGGVVNKPTLFPMANGTGLMGEAGPEAIMPLRRGADGRLGVEASGGGTSVVVNVNARGTSVQGDEGKGRQLGSAISAAVQAELIKQQRPGGLLAR